MKKLNLDIRKMNDELKSKVPNLNCGGCGYFAYEMWKHIFFKYGVMLQIVRCQIETGGFHIMLKYNDTYFDSKGTGRNNDLVLELDKNISIIRLKWMLLTWVWNPVYQKRFNKVIKNIIIETV